MANQINFSSNGKPKIMLERPSGTKFSLKLTDYALFIEEARNHGWEPKGFCRISGFTNSMINDTRNYIYLFPEVGWVSDSDAKNIALALQKMVNKTKKFLNKDVYDVEFHSFDEAAMSDFYEFWLSCTSAIDIVMSMDGFIVIRPRNSAEYLMSKKKKELMNFIEFCELGEFQILQVINELI